MRKVCPNGGSHRLSPITVNGQLRCERCDNWFHPSECSDEEIGAAKRRADAEYPEMRYTDPEVPKTYKCSKCGIRGVKLWRPYNSFNIELLCAACAEIDQKKKVDLEKSDQIGWFIPAVPSEDGVGYWGYTSVPQAGVDWWKKLPCTRSDV